MAKMWKQPHCPSMYEWINKTQYKYSHTMRYLSFSLKKERNCDTCYSTGEHHPK